MTNTEKSPIATSAARLKLRAADVDDLVVLSAQLQDAIAPVADMQYVPVERRFLIVFNRFRWELPDRADPFERTLSAFEIHQVERVLFRGFALADRDKLLELLQLGYQDGELQLVFAGEAAIRLRVDALDCRLEDFGEPWPTKRRPRHDLVQT